MSKANRSYVYFVTTPGANFQGLYRSADSGLTFSTRSTTPNIMGYYDGTTGTSDLSNGQGWYDIDIDADPKNAEIVYVGGINIWRSNNGGTSWTQVAHWYGGFGADDIHADQHAIEFNNTGNKLYSGNDGGVYYTVNAGSRWINISTGIQNSQIYRIAHAKTDEFVGAHGYQDNGSSQTTRDEFYTYYGGDGMDCQVDPTDANYVYGSYVYGRIYRAIDKTSIRTVGNNGTGGINENGAWLTPLFYRRGSPEPCLRAIAMFGELPRLKQETRLLGHPFQPVLGELGCWKTRRREIVCCLRCKTMAAYNEQEMPIQHRWHGQT